MNQEIYEKYEIIDAHTHIFPDKIAEHATVNIGRFYNLPMNSDGISLKLIQSGDEIGVKKYLVCSSATSPHQTESINNFIAEECSKNPKLFGLGTAHPLSENVEADIEQVKKLGLHGIKIHPDFMKINADSPENFKIYEIIEGVMPVLFHCGDDRYDYSSPKRIANIHKNFPKLKILSAHLGGYQKWDEAEEYLKGLENVCFDISSSMAFMPPEHTAHMINAYGAENCLFGSDFPMWSIKKEADRFLSLGFSEEQNRLVFGQNFKRFFEIQNL